MSKCYNGAEQAHLISPILQLYCCRGWLLGTGRQLDGTGLPALSMLLGQVLALFAVLKLVLWQC